MYHANIFWILKCGAKVTLLFLDCPAHFLELKYDTLRSISLPRYDEGFPTLPSAALDPGMMTSAILV